MLNRLEVVSLTCLALLACDSARIDPTRSQSSPDVVVVQPSQPSVTIRVGQTMSIPRPFEGEWRVDYSATVLQLLNAAEAQRPGPDGWRFRGVAKGETDVALTEVVATSIGGAPPAPRQFLITGRVSD